MKNINYYLIALLCISIISCGLFEDDDLPTEPEKAFVAYFGMDKTECLAPCEVVLTNYSIDAITCEWDFGDGSLLDISCNTAHTYTTPGEYPITLTVTNEEGRTAESTQILKVESESNGEGHPFSGIEVLNSYSNQAIQRVIETNDGFIMLAGDYGDQNPTLQSPTRSLLMRLSYSGNIMLTRELPAGVVGLDMIKTVNDRIFLCGTDQNYGTAFEIDEELNIVRSHVTNLLGSVFTSIDHNYQNQVFVAGYQEISGQKDALVEKLESSFSYIDRWQSVDPSASTRFDNLAINESSVYLNAYLESEDKSVIYKLRDDLSDADALVIVDDSNIVDLMVDDDKVYAASLRPFGFRSHLTQYSHDLLPQQDFVIALPGNSEDILYPTDLHLIDGHYLSSSFILNSGDCVITAALQRVCISGSSCDSELITCPINQVSIVISQIIEMDNGEFLAVGTSSDYDGLFSITYLMLDSDFNLK